MRIFVSVDMEGISGVTRWEDVIPTGIDYGSARRWMTGDVNAAIDGSRRGGATEWVVEENHGAEMLCVLNLDQIDQEATVVRGMPRGMATTAAALAPGQQPFEAMFLVGHHALAGETRGICAHTIYFPTYRRVLCNGRPIGEPEMFIRMAAERGTPTALIAGDDVVCATVANLVPNVETVVVKHALSNTAGWIIPPARAQRMIAEGAQAAAEKIAARAVPLIDLESSYEFEIELDTPIAAEPRATMTERHPEFVVLDDRRVRFSTETMHHGFRCAAILSYVVKLGHIPSY